MDPVSHSCLGACAALAVFGPRIGRRAAVAGLAGGLIPDADIFLAPISDPALPFELHRHFTHALVLAPLLGAVAAAPLLAVPRWRTAPWLLLAAGAVGCLTHGVLDQCTSYGTHLWWPFIGERTAWDSLGIIDPFVTLPLLVGVVAGCLLKRPPVAAWAVLVVVCYAALGVVQRERVLTIQHELAAARGDTIEHGRALPTLGNAILWRSLYRTPDGVMRADAVRVPLWGDATVREGTASERVADIGAVAEAGSDELDRLARFAAFADGFVLAREEGDGSAAVLYDARYSLATAGFEPMWGVRVAPYRAIGGDRLAWRSGVSARRERAGDLLAEILGTTDATAEASPSTLPPTPPAGSP
jgi:inner membrane protein